MLTLVKVALYYSITKKAIQNKISQKKHFGSKIRGAQNMSTQKFKFQKMCGQNNFGAKIFLKSKPFELKF